MIKIYEIGQEYGLNNDILYLESMPNGFGKFLCPICNHPFKCLRKQINKRKCCPKCQRNSLLKVHVGDTFGKLTVLKILEEKDSDNRRLCLVECSCEKHTILKVSTHHLLSGNTKSCGCLQKEWAIKKNKESSLDITGQKFGLLTAIKDTGISSPRGHIWLFDCDCGNKNILIPIGDVHRNTRVGTISCGCLKQSKGEYLIEQALNKLGIQYDKEHMFQDCRNPITNNVLRFDFYLPTYNTCIEFDGEQHFIQAKRIEQYWWGQVDLEAIKGRDIIKNQYCKNNNIKLYRIPYTELNNIDSDYILNMIEGKNDIYLR